MDAFDEIGGYKGSVLLVHGTADDIVSIDYSKMAHEVLENSELLVIEGGKHGFAPEQDEIAIATIKQFVNE